MTQTLLEESSRVQKLKTALHEKQQEYLKLESKYQEEMKNTNKQQSPEDNCAMHINMLDKKTTEKTDQSNEITEINGSVVLEIQIQEAELIVRKD